MMQAVLKKTNLALLNRRVLTLGGVSVFSVLLTFNMARADIFSDITGLLTGGGSFYDFSSVFTDTNWDNPVGDIISGSISTDGGWTGTTEQNAVFDQVFEQVAGDLGIPSELKDIIYGKNPTDYLGGVLNDVLGDIGLGNTNLEDVLGANGIPVLDDINKILKNETLNADQGTFNNTATIPVVKESPSGMATINVNPALIGSVQSLDALNEAITAIGLTEQGQQITAARQEAANTIAYSSSQMGANSTALAEGQLEIAQDLDQTVREQISTQDAIKEALTGLTLLTAQATQISAYQVEQGALGAQSDGFMLNALTETRDGVFGAGLGIQSVNEQLLRDTQMELAEDSSDRIGLSTPIRMIGPMR